MTGLLENRIPETARGLRLDQALAALFPDFSRSRLKAWIDSGRVSVDGIKPRARDLVSGGEWIRIDPLNEAVVEVAPEPIPLDIVFEDEALLIVAKPAGLVVHPGAGNPSATLQNALLSHDAQLAQLPRAGLIHRIDKDTSGLLVVAKTLEAHTRLVRALAGHEIEREYEAVATGVMTAGGTVNAPIDRHRVDRLKMAVRAGGREAITHYRVVERFAAHTHVRVHLETGRTHQIRVHLAHAGFALIGDPLYGRRLVLPRGASPSLIEILRGFKRQALHAGRLKFIHPMHLQPVEFKTPWPADFEQLLTALRRDARAPSVDPRNF